mgnify:CR=1 FL=1
MNGRSKQKIRASVRRVLVEIKKTTSQMEDAPSPFAGAGQFDLRYLSAEGAYKHLMETIDWDQVDSMIEHLNEKAWREDEYAKMAAVLLTTATKLTAIGGGV